ncbi:unnamed protein product, partial [Acanthoscelides obtectus]
MDASHVKWSRMMSDLSYLRKRIPINNV